MAFTYFFRDRQTLDQIQQHFIPIAKNRRVVHIWDAGCANGAEPYSIAMMLAENLGKFGFRKVRIHATDINENVEFKEVINKGEYPKKDLKRIPTAYFSKYFRPVAGSEYFKIEEEICRRVEFQEHDLRSLEPIRDQLSLIVCKNVLLHLKPQERIDVLKMFHQALASDGILALEQTQKLPKEVAHLFMPIIGNTQLFIKTERECDNTDPQTHAEI